MQQRLLFLLIIFIIILLSWFLFPKNVGGVLCGPVCPPNGLHYYKQSCFGIENRFIPKDCIDCSYTDMCFGIPVGKKKCYGVSYTETENFEDKELDCNYPCNDEDFKNICQNRENITFNGITYVCEWINRECDLLITQNN